MAQYILDGTEQEIPVLGAYASIKNNTGATIYASNKPDIDITGEEVTPIQDGESVVIPNCDKAVYVQGTGEIAVESANQLFNFFKSAPVGGGGGGGGTGGVSQAYVDRQDKATLTAAKKYTDEQTASDAEVDELFSLIFA